MAGKGNHGHHGRRSTDFPGSSQEHSQEQHEGLKESAQEMASHLGESAGQMRGRGRAFVSGMAGQAQEAKTSGGIPVYNVSMPLMKRHWPDRPPCRILEIPLSAIHEEAASGKTERVS